MTTDVRKRVLICDTQPVAIEGMKWLIENSGDLCCAGSVGSLDAVHEALYPTAVESAAEETALLDVNVMATEAAEPLAPDANVDAVVIDKGLGLAEVMAFLQRLAGAGNSVPVVVWGAITESEALRLLQAGARGILRRTSDSGTLLTCLRAVIGGGTWMEDGIFGSAEKLFHPERHRLTQRESEVVVLVEKGLRNRDIARMLGIKPGTVKIHLKHIFEKTGVRGRYGLAFTGLRDKGSIALTEPQQYAVTV